MKAPPYGRVARAINSTPPGLVLANGCPKSGTHALMEWFRWLGMKRAPGILKAYGDIPFAVRATPADSIPWSIERVREHDESGHYMHAHLSYGEWDLGNAKVVTVFRDPRNVLVSYVRWRGWALTEAWLLEALEHYFVSDRFVDVYRTFLGWRDRSLVIRYEEIPRDFIQGSVYEGAEQDRSTWNAEPSDWRTCWTARVDDTFRDMGGYEVLEEAGYASGCEGAG